MSDALERLSAMLNKPAPPERQELETYILAGLGNPGRQYSNNRHNIGFLILDRLAQRLGWRFGRMQFRALTAEGRYEGRRLILAKPQTYMNESGVAVGALVRFYKAPSERLLVAHDDVDLPFGRLRLRPGGGSAGQKGVASIITRLGTQEFPRLRFGIGRPPGQKLAAAYVLEDFDRTEQAELETLLDDAAQAVLLFVTEGLNPAMNRYNPAAEA